MAAPSPKRITQLDLATPLSPSDLLAVVQNNQTKRTTVAQLQSATDTSCECTLVSRYTTVGTDANTLKKYLYTYTLPDDIMTADGSWLEIHAAGSFAANGNTKLVSVGIKQDSTGLNQLNSIPSGAYNDDNWLISLKIQRSSQGSYVVHRYVSVTNNVTTPLQTPGVLHDTGTVSSMSWVQTLQITVEGTNSTASANDITCHTFIVEAHLLDPNS